MKFDKDPYQVEYEAIQDVEVLREGNWNGRDYDAPFIEDIANTYDSNILRAPLQRTHWGDGGAGAIGHVLDLKVKDDLSPDGAISLVAVTGFLKEGVDLIESGQINERSISWSDLYPMNGLPYMLHLMIIGDSNPASIGMEPISFNPDKKEKATIEKLTNISLEGELGLSWTANEEEFNFRVRVNSRFKDGTMRDVWLDKKAGIKSVVGKLNLAYLSEDQDPESLFKRSITFLRSKNWTFKLAKEWVSVQKENGNLVSEFILQKDQDEINSEHLNKIIIPDAISGTNPIETRSKDMSDDVEKVQDVSGDPPIILDPEPDPTPALTPTNDTVNYTVEPDSATDLERTNTRLSKELEVQTKKNLELKREYADKLQRTVNELKAKTIETEVDQLLVDEFITPAYKEHGLVKILAALPEADFELRGKTVSYREALYELFRFNGKLKIKHEFKSKMSPLGKTGEDEFSALEVAGRSNNTDLARLATKISEDEGIPYDQALPKALKQTGGEI